MKTLRWLWLFGLFTLAACATINPTPPPARRTPIPTWTLPAAQTRSANDTALPPESTPDAPTPLPPPAESLTPSPTARPGIDPVLDLSPPDPSVELVTAVPPAMPQLHLDSNIINILLVGRDTPRDTQGYRTDVMIVASLNKSANSVTLLTLPRDLFVYIPGWTMNRLNTAAYHGDAIGYPGGGMALLAQTILYNTGIPLHGWARIDFGGFQDVVDILGGVDIPVSCEMTDWRLKDPALDQQEADNWELFTVTSGMWHMDGDMALWYARSRKRSSDFDRSRRQHQILRAMFEKGLQLNALTKAPELYDQYVKIVDTDLGLGDVLQFVPMATQLNFSDIKSRFIGRAQVFSWVTPGGAQVLLPDRAGVEQLVAEAFLPPSGNLIAREVAAVEIWNGTANQDWAALAAVNLEWAGLNPVLGQSDATNYATTTLYDYTLSPKGSARKLVQETFFISDANVMAQPEANAAYPFRVVLGSDFVSCVRPASLPRPTPTPGADTGGGATIAESEIVHAAAVNGPPPQVDGNLEEWTALLYPLKAPAFGPGNWQGVNDLSASWNAAWDDGNLYLALKVRDDVLVQEGMGENLFRGDSLEVLLDIDPGSRTEERTTRDFQVGLSPGNWANGAPPEAFLWWPNDKKRALADVRIVTQRIEGGYAIEIAIPWSVFELTPFASEGFAFTLRLNDDDTPGSAEQESQVASTKDHQLTDPRTWGILVLDAPVGP